MRWWAMTPSSNWALCRDIATSRRIALSAIELLVLKASRELRAGVDKAAYLVEVLFRHTGTVHKRWRSVI